MGRGVKRNPGGICALFALINQYGRAIEYDLLVRGYSLKDAGDRIDLGQLNILVTGLLQEPGSHLRREIAGTARDAWGLDVELLATIVDQLNGLQYGLAGGKGTRPQPVTRPFESADSSSQTFGYDPIPIEDFEAWWAEN